MAFTVRSARAWLVPRARLVARFSAVGVVLGALGVFAVVVTGESVRVASTKVFAVAALVLGFALLGWSGSVFAGEGIERMQRYMETGTHWSERDSRQAMAVLGSLGFGGMVGASILQTLFL